MRDLGEIMREDRRPRIREVEKKMMALVVEDCETMQIEKPRS